MESKNKIQEEIKKTERLFELMKKKGTLRSFDDKKKTVNTTFDTKTPEEIIKEYTEKRQQRVPSVQELIEKKKKEI